MKKFLCVIDMQNDFITGSLANKEAEKIIPSVIDKIKQYKNNKDFIFITQDTHYYDYLQTNEGKHLPIEHCIANTDGWQLCDEVYNELKTYNNKYNILKHTFGSIELINKLKDFIPEELEKQKDYIIEISGLCFDICIIVNALLIKTNFPESKIIIDLKCTAATSLEAYEASKIILERNQVELINE